MKIHEVLQLMREGKGVTQKEFTEGVLSYSYYSRVERGESYISEDFLLELLKKMISHYQNLVIFRIDFKKMRR